MNADPLLPVAPARVKTLLLPIGKIKADRFASFVTRLQPHNAVSLRHVKPDGRPNRNMFSPQAYPDGSILYDYVTHIPSPSHLALTPFDLYREPMAIVALADGKELYGSSFSKRHSVNGTGATTVEKNIRALYQELEDLRDSYPKALVHHVLVFDYAAPSADGIPMPEGISTAPLDADDDAEEAGVSGCVREVSSLLLAEMTTLARSFEAMTAVESPGQYSAARQINGAAWHAAAGGQDGLARRNSQLSDQARPASESRAIDRSQARMSMPVVSSRPGLPSSNSTPGRPSTPTQSNGAVAEGTDTTPNSGPSTPEHSRSRPDTGEHRQERSRDRVSVHGFGPGGANEKWRLKGKGRVSVIVGSLYLQAGRWPDSLRQLQEGAAAARSLNDHIWHGKALELILVNLFLLGWSNREFQIPAVCMPTQERPRSGSSGSKTETDGAVAEQPKHLRNLQTVLPELLERILGLYSRISADNLPPLPLAETTIRFSKILSALHLCAGKLTTSTLNMIVSGKSNSPSLSKTPQPLVTPSRQQVVNLLFKALPSSATELLTTVDRASILCGIISVLGPLGLRRKKAMVTRELVSVLIGGLVEARTRGAAEAGVHPAAGLVSLAPGNDATKGAAVALDLAQGDVEQGVEGFLRMLCKAYAVVELDGDRAPDNDTGNVRSSDEAILARVKKQTELRHFGFAHVKLNILRGCINFSEALPDFQGVLKFSSDLLRTAGSGIVPGSRSDTAAPIIDKEEQARLVANIARTSALVQKLGLLHVAAEYWDEFLVRGIKPEPLPEARAPVPHAKTALPGAATERASQDLNPFIYNPFLKQPDKDSLEKEMVAGEVASFKVTLQNTYEVDVEIESIRLDTEGVEFDAMVESTVVGPYRTQAVRLKGTPKEKGTIKIMGAVVKVAGCRERRFPIFEKPWTPPLPEKVKGSGEMTLLDRSTTVKTVRQTPEITSLSLNVIPALPLLVVKSTTLQQSSIMLLDGERQRFSVTLQNLSSVPVDFILFSFKDSTQGPLQTALDRRDASPAEMYEYEWVLMKKQALRLPKGEQRRYIAAGGEATFDFEILGKAGLTDATIQIDYTSLGVPPEEVTKQFYTRQVSVDMTVTVNASVDLSRLDALPVHDSLPPPLWDRLGVREPPAQARDYCLLAMDLRNSWPSPMTIGLESTEGVAVKEDIQPGHTSRFVLPMRRIYLEDPHATVPSLNPTKERQFVVSTSKISPETERSNREAFWIRERMLDNVNATWSTTTGRSRSGVVDLRRAFLHPHMVDVMRVEDVGIEISVSDTKGSGNSNGDAVFVDESVKVTVHVINRSRMPLHPLVRLIPALRHRPTSAALDYTRKIAWNGTLQQLLPEVEGRSSVDFVIGMTPLCRGVFELSATVEEVHVDEDAEDGDEKGGRNSEENKEDSIDDTRRMMMVNAVLGPKSRRVWHSRRPALMHVRDRP